MNDNTSNVPTNINTIVTVTSIIITFVSLKLDIKWLFWVTVVLLILSVVFYFILLDNKRRKQKELYIKSCLDNDFFRNYWIDRHENRPYIGIEYSRTEDFNKRYSLKDFFVYDFFRWKHRGTKYAMILGETGSGKTMAMVNLLMDHVNSNLDKNQTYNIRIFSMRNEKLWEDVNRYIDIKERDNYILLLDALDENKEAQNALTNGQINVYMKDLKEKTKDYARVVVSCRTQFFKYLKEEPGESEKVWDKCHLAPFGLTQVNDYLTQKFGVPSSDPKYEKARQIVFSCQKDFCRPLILSWIDELVDKNEIFQEGNLSLYDIYAYIIDAWLNREAFNLDDNMVDQEKRSELEYYSLSLAEYMYKNDLLAITNDAYKEFLMEYNIKDTNDLFRGRSLLSRGNNGYQFSHKSFYEYFLAKIFFEEPDKIQSLQGLDFAMKIFDEIVTDFLQKEHREEEKSRMAKALNIVGIEYCRLHQYKNAERKLDQALMIRHELAKKGTDESKLLVTITLSDMANIYNDIHHYEDAEKNYKKALEILDELAKRNPLEFNPNLAMTLNNLAILYYHTYKYKESESEYRKALNITRQLTHNNYNGFQYLFSIILNNLSNVHRDSHRYKYAKREYRKALFIRRKLAKQNRDAFLPNVAQTLNDLAILHRATLQYQDAEREYDEALGILEELTSQKTDAFQPYMAIVMNNLGNLLREQQKYNEAKEKYKKALDIRRQLAERNPDAYRPYLARTLNNLANLHRDTKYYNEAKDEYFESLSISPSDPDKAITWNNIATLYLILEKYDSALDAYQNTLGYYQTLAKQYPNPFRPFLARTLRIMALLYRNLGDIANAETMEQECLTIYKNMKKINSEAFYEDVDDVMQLFNNTKPLT